MKTFGELGPGDIIYEFHYTANRISANMLKDSARISLSYVEITQATPEGAYTTRFPYDTASKGGPHSAYFSDKQIFIDFVRDKLSAKQQSIQSEIASLNKTLAKLDNTLNKLSEL